MAAMIECHMQAVGQEEGCL